MNEYTGTQNPIAYADADARGRFINRVYMHVALAILAFTGVEVFLFKSGLAVPIAQAMLSVSWLLILGAFMLVGWFATRTAHRLTSPAAQYGALALYVVAYAILFVPMLVIAQYKAQQTGVDIICDGEQGNYDTQRRAGHYGSPRSYLTVLHQLTSG